MKGSRTTLVLLIALFGAPLVATWALYFNPDWVPSGRTNRGVLIDPVEPVADLVLGGGAGAALPLSTLQDSWVLLLPFERCDADCLDLLLQTRQVRLALGAERERLVRLLVQRQPPAPALTSWLSEHHPDLRLVVGEAGYGALGARLARLGDGAAGTYLVDPLGNLMMHHPAGTPAEGLLKDLEHLFKLSKHWGTHAGR